MNALDVILNHQSVRNYTGEQLTDLQVANIEKAVMQASTSCYFQMVSVVKIKDKAVLEKIAKLSGNQEHIAKCAEFWMFCVDMTKLMHAIDLQPPFAFRYFYSGLNDTSIACQNALIAAEAQGLGGTIIGGFKSGITEITEMLKLPVGVAPCLGLVLGVVDKEYLEEQKPRFDRSWIFMDETYEDRFSKEELEVFDAKVNNYYLNRKYNNKGATWSSACKYMCEKGSSNNADEIIALFKKQGFTFE